MTFRKWRGYLCWALLPAVLLAMSVTRLRGLLTVIRTGKNTASVSPAPVYGFLPVPGTAPGGPGALGADFSQVYFSAKAIASGDSAYAPANPAYRDRLGRLPNYPPLTNHIYVVLAGLPYDQALALHSVGTLGLYLVLSTVVLVAWKQARYVAACAAVALLLGYSTPVGVSHFERGQFDWIVASSCLLAFCGLFETRGRLGLCLASGFLGAMKWTSAPFLGAMTALGLFGSARRRLAFLATPLAFALSVLAFLPESVEYWPSLRRYELTAPPTPLSYEWLLPKALAKAAQPLVVLSFTAFFLARHRRSPDRQARLEAVSLPFALAMAIQGLSFTAQATEYRLVAVLAGVPALLVWLAAVEGVSTRVKVTIAGLFGAFLVLAFRVLDDVAPIGREEMLFVYLAFSAAFLGVALRVAARRDSPGTHAGPVAHRPAFRGHEMPASS
jgi:Glycosyltransferase family 87